VATRRVNANFRESFMFSRPFKVSPTRHSQSSVTAGDPGPAPTPHVREADSVCPIRQPCQKHQLYLHLRFFPVIERQAATSRPWHTMARPQTRGLPIYMHREFALLT